MYILPTCLALVLSTAWAQTTPLTGSHTDIPRWCGKPYKAGSPNFDPGGMLQPPEPQPSQLLDLRIKPRYSIYVSSERKGEFVVDAELSNYHGQPYEEQGHDRFFDGHHDDLFFQVHIGNAQKPLLSGRATVNTTENLFTFDLSKVEPRLQPYNVRLTARATRNQKSYTVSTALYYLPEKRSGSTVKIDQLNGGMLMANNVSNYVFEPILPYGFYTSCSGYLNYSLENVSAYAEQGYTGINPVCAFSDGDLSYLFDWLDEVNMPFQYDMRGSYYNLSSVREQVALVKDNSALLSWYTADEPDGWEYAFDSTTDSYNLLKELDPYHPTGLVLNCENYYFDEYTIGTDYIMEDAYPVGINPTYSRRWDTVCNETYGDCGCDNCVGSLFDVSNRLDTFYNYQDWLGRAQKPLWAVPQAFSGEQYWARDPTQAEVWAMNVLAFNHRAKAIMTWTFPTTVMLEDAHSQMARVVTKSPIKDFLLGSRPTVIRTNSNDGLDISVWRQGEEMLIGFVNADEGKVKDVEVPLPASVHRIISQPWGNLDWTVANGRLQAKEVGGLSTSFLILAVEEHGHHHGHQWHLIDSSTSLEGRLHGL